MCIRDRDGDGKISVYEYVLFAVLMQVHRQDAFKYFNTEERGGAVTQEQFIEFLSLESERLQIKPTESGHLPDPRRQKMSQEEFVVKQAKLVNKIFGGKEKFSLQDFYNLRDSCYTDLYTYEFSELSPDQNAKISAEDFAKSIAAYVEPSLVMDYLKNIEDYPAEMRFTLDEYIGFQKFILNCYDDLVAKLSQYRSISKKKLIRLMEDYSKQSGYPINPSQADIFVALLDRNKDGHLQYDEVVGVLKNRVFYGYGNVAGPRINKPLNYLKHKMEVWEKKAKRIWEIVQENQ
eukprot:TRINITY_DN6069_c0_g1_i1.p1 TRINITY_DN6069_c0_g1~~TRINITY_DN6069_c0_g1_i1.p1  ORF type:complete len:291 (-),score=57.11 TRINITY_DN6069_c0_g1_i1:141-1013(-)